MRASKTGTEIRREQIAEAALELIGAGGLSNLSIAGIAARVGIVPSAVYRHYASKEAVVDAVLDLLRRRMLAHACAVCTETPRALDRLHALLVRHMTMLIENRAFTHVVFAHLSQCDDQERWSRLNLTMCAYLDEVAGIVEQGQAVGEIRAGIPPRTIAVMFIGLILPTAVLHRVSGGEFDPFEQADAAWPIFVRGVRPEEGLPTSGPGA